jgi:hypothetical protein
MSCPKIRKLSLGKCDNLDDELLFNLLEANPLAECEEICLLDAPGLTIQSARYILMCLAT